MTMRRFLGKTIVLAAIYAFALHTVLEAATLAGHAASEPALAPAVLCSGDSRDGPAGNGESHSLCAHCILPGCGAQQTISPLSGVQLPPPPAVAVGLLFIANEAARAVPATAGPHLARAPPTA